MTYITSKPVINCIHHPRVVQGRVVIVPFSNCVHTIHTSFLCQIYRNRSFACNCSKGKYYS